MIDGSHSEQRTCYIYIYNIVIHLFVQSLLPRKV